LASSAGAASANIARHGDIKGVSTNDVVNMTRRIIAWLDDRGQDAE
jgi:hypothetical protein